MSDFKQVRLSLINYPVYILNLKEEVECQDRYSMKKGVRAVNCVQSYARKRLSSSPTALTVRGIGQQPAPMRQNALDVLFAPKLVRML